MCIICAIYKKYHGTDIMQFYKMLISAVTIKLFIVSFSLDIKSTYTSTSNATNDSL